MKLLSIALLGLLASTAPALADAPFPSLTCRSFDYFQLGGDRKVLEIAVRREEAGTYQVTVSRIYETLLPNREYREKERALVEEMPGLTCLQAAGTTDPKVVTCASREIKAYFGLSRLDRTVLASAFSSRPGQVVRSTTFEAAVYGRDPKEYSDFSPEDCVLR
jgi:hypothetical protein